MPNSVDMLLFRMSITMSVAPALTAIVYKRLKDFCLLCACVRIIFIILLYSKIATICRLRVPYLWYWQRHSYDGRTDDALTCALARLWYSRCDRNPMKLAPSWGLIAGAHLFVFHCAHSFFASTSCIHIHLPTEWISILVYLLLYRFIFAKLVTCARNLIDFRYSKVENTKIQKSMDWTE